MLTDRIYDSLGNRVILCSCPESYVDELREEEVKQVRKNMFIWTRYFICENCEMCWTKEEYLMSNGEASFLIVQAGSEEE
tara:strand:+ start:207 stop:446 length:240 start_codon:yes stop_codon:yes gene_type:complete